MLILRLRSATVFDYPSNRLRLGSATKGNCLLITDDCLWSLRWSISTFRESEHPDFSGLLTTVYRLKKFPLFLTLTIHPTELPYSLPISAPTEHPSSIFDSLENCFFTSSNKEVFLIISGYGLP